MNIFRVHLRLRSPLGTPLVADTLFGHLCWGLAYHEGDAAVGGLLEQMTDSGPPLVMSDPLPAGHLPMPVLPAPAPTTEDKLLEELIQSTGSLPAAHDAFRALLRRPFISREAWDEVCGSLDVIGIARALMRRTEQPAALPIAMTVAHNTINRLSSQTQEKRGFFFDELHFPTEEAAYDVWVRTSYDAKRIEQFFTWGLAGGYGRDASTGKGQISVEAVVPAELPKADRANACMTLGTCAPKKTDPSCGWWNIDVRHGKLGGPLASIAGSDDNQSTVFKKPLILLAGGAVFHSDQPPPVMGRIVKDVHPTRPEVVTCGLTLTVPCRLSEEALACLPTR